MQKKGKIENMRHANKDNDGGSQRQSAVMDDMVDIRAVQTERERKKKGFLSRVFGKWKMENWHGYRTMRMWMRMIIIMMMVQQKCGLWQEQRERVESERQYGKTSKLHLVPNDSTIDREHGWQTDRQRERESGRRQDQAEHSSATVRDGSEKLVILLIV